MKKISREKYNELGEQIQEWCDECGLETDSDQDVELINRFLSVLGVERGW